MQPSAAGLGRYSGRGRGRNSGRFNGRQGRGHGGFARPSIARFHGETDGLNGYIYECTGPSDADKFIETTKKIAGYVRREYTYGSDIGTAVEEMELQPLPQPVPVDPFLATVIDAKILDKKIEAYVKIEAILEENNK